MSHAISNTNGFNEMAYVGEKPWHGLGQELESGASLEVWEAQAGMAWRVQRSKVRFAVAKAPEDGSPTPTLEWPDRHVLFRSDTKAPLGLVSDRYQVVQPREVLAFFSDIAKANGLQLETAGTLNGGRQYWAMARTGYTLALGGVDRINAYALLATSADGSMATTAKFTSERVVCANTLAIAMGENAKSAIRVKHSTEFNAEQVRMDMGLADEQWNIFTQNAAKLADKRLTRQGALSVLIDAIGDREAFKAEYIKTNSVEKAIEAQPNMRQMAAILDLFNGKARGSQAVTANGTAWGLVNAATEYYDHEAGRTADTRIQSAWFGINSTRKQSILGEALKVADAA